jgi:hypothetical protein
MKYIKTFENLNQARSIIAKKMEAFDKLKDLLKKNLGYIGKFTEYLMNENIPYESLEELYKQLIELKSKGQTLDISKLKYEKALDKIQEIKNESSVRNLINQFPSEQKTIARQLSSTKDGFNLLLKVSKQSDITAFITKISRYKTSSDLRSALTIFSKERFNQREEVKNYVESSKSRIAIEKDDILIVEIKAFEDIKKLGSDTSWCILSLGMYNSYTKNRLQFILFDYSKEEFETKFKIGFTLNKNLTVHACHDMLDASCKEYLGSLLSQNEINFTQLVKVEDVEVVKPIVPSEINSRTTIKRLEEIRDNCTKAQIPDIVKKIISIGVFNNYHKSKILSGILKKYFADKQYITVKDFEPFGLVPGALKQILDLVSIKEIFVDSNRPNFSLSNEILLSVIPILTDDTLKQITMTNIYNSEGLIKNRYQTARSFPMLNPQKIESTKLLSDRLNNIYKDEPVQPTDFIDVMCVLNALLGRPVDKKFEPKIKESTKLRFVEFLKLPFDPDEAQMLSQISKDFVQYVIKKQPTKDFYLYKATFENALLLVEHLKDFKLTFKLGTETLREIRKSYSSDGRTFPSGKNPLYDALNKMPQRPRSGKEIEEGNLKLVIR